MPIPKSMRAARDAALVAVLLVLAACSEVSGKTGSAITDATYAAEFALGTAFVPEGRPLLDCSDADWREIVAKLFPVVRPAVIGPSGCLHALRLFGPDKKLEAETSSSPLLDLFFDAERAESAFGMPLILATRYGARYRWRPELYPVPGQMHESHQAQVLAGLGELGVSSQRVIDIGGEAHAIGDVVRDLVASFDFRGELEWKCLAAIFYLAGAPSWRNRFGETFDFDSVAAQLVNKDLESASCCGAHVLHALTLLVRLDAERAVLGEAARRLAWATLSAWRGRALASQREDGSWSTKWWSGQVQTAGAQDSVSDTLLVTGHLAETFLYLPSGLRVEDDCLRRAGSWLLTRLQEATPAECKLQLCPVTHAACVIRQLRR